jgi:pyruvate-formate lyase-activating enzyme
MSEETTTHVMTIVIQARSKWNKVELFDFSGGEPTPLASGEGSNWRTALGEALSKITLSSDTPEKTINDVVKEKIEEEGE